MTITFRDFIARNPGKKHSIELEILYQMLFFRVSGDKNTKSYDHLKILLKIFYFHFFSLPVEPVTGLAVIDFSLLTPPTNDGGGGKSVGSGIISRLISLIFGWLLI